MDQDFYNNYHKYFLWNKALLDYYFSENREVILLYVDSKLLNNLGKRIGIQAEDYKADFISSVEGFCRNYLKYTTPNKENNTKKNEDKIDVLDIAHIISTTPIKYYDKFENDRGEIRCVQEKNKPIEHKLPFLAIIVYVILKFDNGTSQKWDNVGNVSSKSKNNLHVIWERINEQYPNFSKNATVFNTENRKNQDHVGLIKYHMYLSTSDKNKIYDVIYKNGIWESIDRKSYWEILGFIQDALINNATNKDLIGILNKSINEEICKQKIQSVFENFDVDDYLNAREERRRNGEYNMGDIRIKGKFALGLSLDEGKIVLLTTIQDELNLGDFEISDGGANTMYGYNPMFVKYQGSDNVKFREYELKIKDQIYIKSLSLDNVVFFYEYDDNFFIQTREILPAKYYIVAVRNGHTEEFDKWCSKNENEFIKCPIDETESLFGSDWIIYETNKKVNGQYYNVRNDNNLTNDDDVRVEMKGGIRNTNNIYFINALPYFEIPKNYEIEKINIYINFNGEECVEYDRINVDRKIILDIYKVLVDDYNVIDITLEYNNQQIFNKCGLQVSGQKVNYDRENEYKFDSFGIINEDHTGMVYTGSCITEEYRINNVTDYKWLEIEEKTFNIDDFYFVNLLAACCYNSENSEISHSKFLKCVRYASTRLEDLDVDRKGFDSKVRDALSRAGILSIDYSNRKYQAIPPLFMRIPFSDRATRETQFILLTGCYTRLFLDDLCKFCNDNCVTILVKNNEIYNEVEQLLPPVVLLGYNFNVNDFRKLYNHQCEFIQGYDFASSLHNMIPSYCDIASKFDYSNHSSCDFLSSLDPPRINTYPRIRSRSSNRGTIWYIEKENYQFAEIQQGLLPWASMLCFYEQNSPMIWCNENSDTLFIIKSILLPTYVRRALYIMNVGLPKVKKVFTVGNPNCFCYLEVEEYDLTKERRNVFMSKISGDSNSESSTRVRRYIRSNCKMKLFTSKYKIGNNSEHCLMLLDGDNEVAIAYKGKVYLKLGDHFKLIDSTSVNEVMTFLITEKKWQIKENSICRSVNYSFESIYKVLDEKLLMPNFEDFNEEEIAII